jgi:hypothetical protein
LLVVHRLCARPAAATFWPAWFQPLLKPLDNRRKIGFVLRLSIVDCSHYFLSEELKNRMVSLRGSAALVSLQLA